MSDPQQPSASQPQPPAYQPQQPAYQAQPPAFEPPTSKPAKNTLGLVALILAAVGFIFGCIPGALVIGWILLPIAFILGIVSVCLRGKAKWQGVTAIVLSVVGTIVAFVVFFAVAATALSNAVEDASGGDTTVSEQQPATDEPSEEATNAEVGTRENPIPLGTAFSNDDWTVVINSVTQNAAEQINAANGYPQDADPGTEFLLINYTVTYTGDDADGEYPAMVQIEYVTAGGVTVNLVDKFVVAPDAINSTSVLYTGATVTGNTAIQVPTPVDGVLAVTPGVFGDKVFVAVQ